ncbi:ARPP-2 domain-containing protein, partial [Streptomyces sp. NPDC002545]
LKTFRLSENQVRRGHLLTHLAAHDWHLPATATALGLTEPQLALRLETSGFPHLLRQDVLDHYRKQSRTGNP